MFRCAHAGTDARHLLASGKLVGGTVKITVGTGSLSVGSHKLTVKYAGSTIVAASQGTATVKVTR